MIWQSYCVVERGTPKRKAKNVLLPEPAESLASIVFFTVLKLPVPFLIGIQNKNQVTFLSKKYI